MNSIETKILKDYLIKTPKVLGKVIYVSKYDYDKYINDKWFSFFGLILSVFFIFYVLNSMSNFSFDFFNILQILAFIILGAISMKEFFTKQKLIVIGHKGICIYSFLFAPLNHTNKTILFDEIDRLHIQKKDREKGSIKYKFIKDDKVSYSFVYDFEDAQDLKMNDILISKVR